jgi:plastocyanin
VPDGKINYAKPPASAPVQSGVIPITYREISIEPDTVKAKVGSTVKWTNVQRHERGRRTLQIRLQRF